MWYIVTLECYSVRKRNEIRSFVEMKVKVKLLSRVRLFVNPWTVAYQAPPFMGFSRQEYWSGLPFPSPCTDEDGSKDYHTE